MNPFCVIAALKSQSMFPHIMQLEKHRRLIRFKNVHAMQCDRGTKGRIALTKADVDSTMAWGGLK